MDGDDCRHRRRDGVGVGRMIGDAGRGHGHGHGHGHGLGREFDEYAGWRGRWMKSPLDVGPDPWGGAGLATHGLSGCRIVRPLSFANSCRV